MNIMISVLFFSAIFIVNHASACGGDQVPSQISFKNGSDASDLIVTIKPENGTGREILDDTGYIGLYLGTTYLATEASKSGSDQIDLTAKKQVADFLKQRVLTLSKKLQAYARPDEWAAIGPALDNLQRMFSSPKVSKNELSEAMQNLNVATKAINVTASERLPGASEWGVERPFHKLDLPSGATRGCGATVAGFNPSVSAGSSSKTTAAGQGSTAR